MCWVKIIHCIDLNAFRKHYLTMMPLNHEEANVLEKYIFIYPFRWNSNANIIFMFRWINGVDYNVCFIGVNTPTGLRARMCVFSMISSRNNMPLLFLCRLYHENPRAINRFLTRDSRFHCNLVYIRGKNWKQNNHKSKFELVST